MRLWGKTSIRLLILKAGFPWVVRKLSITKIRKKTKSKMIILHEIIIIILYFLTILLSFKQFYNY